MATYKSIIAYDGTDYRGFQRQTEMHRTVQGELERGLKKIGWRDSSIKAAGRTDAGVHARGQVIAYSLDWRSEAQDLTRALNANLPVDIAVWHTEISQPDFHPRYDAQRRKYSYVLFTREHRDPLRERYSWRVSPAPSIGEMNYLAQKLVGVHDFAAFGQAPVEGGYTQREVYSAQWEQDAEQLVFRIEGNAFLYHMVRRLVAAMVKCGQKNVDKSEFVEMLLDPSRRWEGKIAPPNGLCLEEVSY